MQNLTWKLAHLAHVELLTPKLDQSIRFFTDILGMYVIVTDGNSDLLGVYNYHDITLEDGQVYALQLVAKGNNLFFENDGKSEAITFTYRKQLQVKE